MLSSYLSMEETGLLTGFNFWSRVQWCRALLQCHMFRIWTKRVARLIENELIPQYSVLIERRFSLENFFGCKLALNLSSFTQRSTIALQVVQQCM